MQQKSRSFIAYYRVSTDRQGTSKLGLEAQQETVRQYLAENDFLISEVVEVESGKKSKDYNTVIPYNGNQQAFGKAIISTDKKRQFRAFRCAIDPQYKMANFTIDDPK
ncbi:MAG: recombinase family protein [Rickettsiales bacterium]|nr:recombinase family protein [Rickettsiales bacterium]